MQIIIWRLIWQYYISLHYNIIFRFTEEDELEDYYIDDFVNHPDIISHPAFPILKRRGLRIQNRKGVSSRRKFLRDIFFPANSLTFKSRQAFGGLSSALRGKGSVRY